MNSNYFSPQQNEITYCSVKHSTHDDFWLLSGISSTHFCFACAVEILEDDNTLNLHRKRILTEFLEVLLSNNTVWKLLQSKRNILVHVLRLLVKLCSTGKDVDYSSLLIECCVLIVKHTNIEQCAAVVVESILKNSSYASSSVMLKLLIAMLKISSGSIEVLMSDPSKAFHEIVKNAKLAKSESMIFVWEIINHVLRVCQSPLQRCIYQEILTTANEVIKGSVNTPVHQKILKCIQCFAEKEYLMVILYEHEISRTNAQKSLLENFKRFLLCEDDCLQHLTISCIATIADASRSKTGNHKTLIDVIIEKGIGEYLLELLTTANERNVAGVFQCLHKLTHSKLFFKMGHMVYGYAETVKAVTNSLHYKDSSALHHGLLLVLVILSKNKNEKTCRQTNEENMTLLNMLVQAFQKSGDQFKLLSVSCVNEFLRYNDLISSNYETIVEFLEQAFQYVDKDVTMMNSSLDAVTERFLCNLYETVMHFAIKLSNQSLAENGATSTPDLPNSTGSDQKCNLTNVIQHFYRLCDYYFIPQAVMKFLPTKNFPFQLVFYKMLVYVVSLTSAEGKKLAYKLAESSFFQLILEFKIMANRASQNADDVAAELLCKLCSSVDNPNAEREMRNHLYPLFMKFTVPLNDWKWVLTPIKSANQDHLNGSRTCALAIMACSHKASQCVIPISNLLQELPKFASSHSALNTLTPYGKRYFMYLWCHLNIPDDVCNGNVVKMFEQVSDHLNHLVMVSPMLVLWMLTWKLSMVVKATALEMFIQSVMDCEHEKYTSLLSAVQHNQLELKFIEVCYHIAAVSKKQSIITETVELATLIHPNLEVSQSAICKTIVYKILLNDESAGEVNVSMLLKCLNDVMMITQPVVDDVELKLLCRILAMSNNSDFPSLRLEVFNFFYLILTKSIVCHNIKPVTIITDDSQFFKHQTFEDVDIIKQSQCSSIIERVNAASILVMTELVHACQHFGISHNAPINLGNFLFLETLVSSALPLLQIATLAFWKQYFQVKCCSSVVTMVNKDGDTCTVEIRTARLIWIALQNLFYYQDTLIQEMAVSCMERLLANVKEVDLFINQAWNQCLEDVALKKMSSSEVDVPTLNMLSVFTKYKNKLAARFLDCIFNSLKLYSNGSCHPNVLVRIIVLLETILDKHLTAVKYSYLAETKAQLHEFQVQLEKEPLDADQFDYYCVSLNGVVFRRETYKLCNAFSQIEKIKMAADKQMEKLDGDTTDSDDGAMEVR